MNTIKRLLASREVRATLAAAEEASRRFDGPEFKGIKIFIKRTVISQPDYFTSEIENGMSPHQVVYSMIVNRIKDMAEKGQVKESRGTLSRRSGGMDLIEIFDAAIEELRLLGVVTEEFAAEQKREFKKNIKRKP